MPWNEPKSREKWKNMCDRIVDESTTQASERYEQEKYLFMSLEILNDIELFI